MSKKRLWNIIFETVEGKREKDRGTLATYFKTARDKLGVLSRKAGIALTRNSSLSLRDGKTLCAYVNLQ